MGCTNSITNQSQSEEQPVKNCKNQIQHQETKIIKIHQLGTQNKQGNLKNGIITKKQQKIKVDLILQSKQLKNNKEFIQISIETSYCVDKLLNTLAQNDMLQDYQLKVIVCLYLKGLKSKNNQALMMKQNRYKNLEAREEKMELQLKKQMEKNQRKIQIRKTLQPKTKEEYVTERRNNRKGHQLTNVMSHRIYEPIAEVQEDKQNLKENVSLKHSKSDYLQSDYKVKFIKRIDLFRSQVNTLVAKENVEI